MGFELLGPSYNSPQLTRGRFLGALTPPFRNGLSRRLKVLGAFVVVENAIAAG
jgi:hypothetical protein